VEAVSTPIVIRTIGQSDVGRKREHNEDAFHCEDALGLCVVADGVGGHAKGEVASAEAVDQVFAFVRQGREAIEAFKARPKPETQKPVRRLLESAVQSACYMVFGMAEMDPSQKGMSTTISALLVVGEHAVIAQVGDSRVYRVRDGSSSQLTEDHTLVNYKLKKGLITEAEARTMKGKNVITRAVGHKDYVEVDVLETDVRAGDLFLLCSDGLHGYLKDGEVERTLGEGPLDDAPARFIALANDRGGKDNITAVLVHVETSGRRTVAGY
jgi:protein phosphatase